MHHMQINGKVNIFPSAQRKPEFLFGIYVYTSRNY